MASAPRKKLDRLSLVGSERSSVLVIDPDDVLIDRLRGELQAEPYEFQGVVCAEDGIEFMRRHPPELVMVNVGLPGGEGVELIQRLLDRSPDYPVVAIAGPSEGVAIAEAVRAGVTHVLVKPFEDMSQVGATLAAALQASRRKVERQEYLENLEAVVAERSAELQEANTDMRLVNARLRQIVETVGSLTNYTSIDEFDAYLLTHFAVIMTPESGRLYRLEQNGLRLGYAVRSQTLEPMIPFPLERGGFLDRGLRARKHLLVSIEDLDDSSAVALELDKPSSVLMFPLRDERRKVVALVVLLRPADFPFRGQDVRIGGIVASFSSEALHVARTADSLRTSELRFRELIHNVRNLVVRLDASGTITFVNQYALDFYGLTEEEAIGRPFVDALIETDSTPAEELALLHAHAAQSGSGAMHERGCVRAGNRPAWVAWTYRQLLDSEGQPRELLCVGTDITDRRQAEMALAKERDLLQRLMDTSPVGIAMFDRFGHRVQANPLAAQLLGPEHQDSQNGLCRVDAGPVRDWNGEPIDPGLLPPQVVLEGGKPLNDLQVQLPRPDGRIAVIRINAVPLVNEDNQVDGMVLVLSDVSQEQALEERLRQSQKMETVGQLAGGVAHDFNNLLLPIIGFSDLLLKEIEPTSPSYDKIMTIRKAGDRARGLTRQLLAFSRKQVLDVQLLDLNEVIVGIRKMLRRTLREDIDLQVVPSDSLGKCRADATQLEQVILNLAINAQHAMPRGGNLILETANVDVDETSARSHADVKPGAYVMVAISDSGCGMDKETLKHIFEPFFTTREKGEGTGLGLAMVYGIVKQHNGAIWVYSELNVGTTFKLYFPRVEEAVKAVQTAEPEEILPFGSETVVIAEDDDLVRNAAVAILRNNGYFVVEVDDIEQCLDFLEKSNRVPELLLTDVVMPRFSGPELYHALRARHTELRVVYMSGYTEKVISRYGILQDGACFIQKPFTMPNLLKIVRVGLEPVS